MRSTSRKSWSGLELINKSVVHRETDWPQGQSVFFFICIYDNNVLSLYYGKERTSVGGGALKIYLVIPYIYITFALQ